MRPKEHRIGASSNGGSHSRFCSSLPASTTGAAPSVLTTIETAIPAQPQASSSPASMPSKTPSPSPPYSSGTCRFINPTSWALARTSSGCVECSSYSAAFGRISFSANSWASSRSDFCSGVSSKEMPLAIACSVVAMRLVSGRLVSIHRTARASGGSSAARGRATLSPMAGLTRSQLVIRSAVAAGALAAGLPGAEVSEAAAEARFDPRSWESVRRQYALRRNLSHFAAFVLAAHPAPVRAAIAAHRRGLDADPFGYLHRRQNDLENGVRAAAARHVGGVAEEIALTDSTTMGLGLLYGGLPLREGDEILTTAHDFYATHESLRLAALRSGATVRRIPLYRSLAAVSEDEIVDTLVRALTARTRVVAVTWVHSSTGLKLPIARIADALAGRALLCVDAVHALGVEAVDVGTLGCDFLAAGCHKWLGGPRGTGIVWGRRDRWADTAGDDPVLRRRRELRGLARRPGTARRREPGRCPPAATTPSSTAGRSARRSASTARSAKRASQPASTRSRPG